MPTFTNYNNYIKAKGNSSICCASKDNCIGNANNLTNYANLYGDDVNISISDNANSEYAIISLNPEIFVNKITVSNETLVFRDSSNKELTLGYKSIDNSYSLFFPSQIPSTLSDNSNNKFALTTNNSGELSWFQPSLNSIDSSINFLYNNLSNAAGITIRNEVTYVTNSNYDNNNLSVYGSGLKFTNNNFATTISFEDISNNLLINQTRFLINGQTNETENGIYLCNSLVSDNSFTLIRTSDLAYGYNAANIYTFVTSLNQGWLQDSCDNDIIIGTNDITFKKFSEFDSTLTEINNGSNINVHENNQIFTINLNNDISISTITISHELLLTSDCSLVFATDSSSIAIQGPSDSSGYTLTLPTKLPDNDPNANYYLRSDASGNLEFFDLSDIQVDISLISLDPNLIIDISNFGDISGYIFDLCNNLNVSTLSVSTLSVSHELLLKSDCSLVFATDSSSIAIQGPSDSSGYTLTLPTKIPDNDPNANYYLRSDASGNLEFFDLSDIQVDISLISLSKNLIIDISNFGDISGYTFDLCNNLNVSTLSVSHELLLKSDCSLIFATDSSSIAIQGPSDSSGYTLTLPTKIPDNDPNANYYLRSDASGNLEFFDLSNIQADISLISLDPNLIIDISNFGDISGYTFDLCNNLNVSTLSVSHELLLTSDCSLVFATDSSSIAIQGPSDSSGYTLTLPTKLPDNDPNANYYLRSDASGNLEFFDLSDIQVDISLISLSKNLIIDISNFGDISGYTFDLCNNLNVSTLSISHELLLKSDCSLVFATDSSSIAIQGPSDSSGYTLTLPTKIPDNDPNANYYLRSDASGNLEFFDLSNIQADISLISLDPNLIIDISNFGDISGYTFDLCNNLNVSTLSVSHELLLKSDCSLVFATDSSSIAIQGPSDSSGYTLTLPTKIPDNDPNANYYLRSDASGNLEFFDLSNIQADISLISLDPNLIIDISNFGDISGYTFDLCNNFNVSTLSVSHELLLKSDCSLVFATDSSSIAIQGPSDSSGYTLTLPTKLPDNNPSANYYLGSDASGNLEFNVDYPVEEEAKAILKTSLVELGGDNLGDQTLFSNFYNIIQNNPVIASNQNSIEQVMKYLVYFDTRQRISQGIPINYYLPSNTFNSSRNTSDGYVNYDLYEYVTYKSTINYINEKNLLHAVNFKPKYLLNFMSIETIVTNYIDSYYSSINKPLLNSFSNDFYLKVLNLITVLKNSNIDDISNNPIYTLNKDIYNLIDTINKHPITKDFSFNEMPCICPINLNPPYYYRSETQTGNVTIITDTPNTISIGDGRDISLNKLMIFGDIEYEQNFVAIKEAQRNAKTRVPNSSANIFMYFYCQNTNNKYHEFDLLFDMSNTDNNNNNLFSSHYNNNKQITDFIRDNSQVCLYDYGNIMFALDNSFNYDNSSNMDYILIPPLTQLNTIRDQINSAGNLSFVNDGSTNITLVDSSFNGNYIDNIIPNNRLSDISGFDCSLSSQLQFVNCLSNNLHTIDLSYIQNDILTSDTCKNILILCPIRENDYILQTNTDTTRVESSTQNIIDASFEDSINRYFIIPQYF